jgi:predicted RNA binding protein YcfA (HicA-like mRNA interferase family)
MRFMISLSSPNRANAFQSTPIAFAGYRQQKQSAPKPSAKLSPTMRLLPGKDATDSGYESATSSPMGDSFGPRVSESLKPSCDSNREESYDVRNFRPVDVLQVLGGLGFHMISQKGSHQKWASPNLKQPVIIAYHGSPRGTVPIGTMDSILRQVGEALDAERRKADLNRPEGGNFKTVCAWVDDPKGHQNEIQSLGAALLKQAELKQSERPRKKADHKDNKRMNKKSMKA